MRRVRGWSLGFRIGDRVGVGGGVNSRQMIEAITWKFRTGAARREPERFGPWQTAYERHSRWSSDGTWARLPADAHRPGMRSAGLGVG